MHLRYELEGDGWAMATLTEDEQSTSVEVSYLHDSLLQLTEATIKLVSRESDEETVIFMGEPGEWHLVLRWFEHLHHGHYSLRQFQDWVSWGLWPETDFRRLQEGYFLALEPLGQNVLEQLDNIYDRYGMGGYRRAWIEHDFPYGAYQRLKGMVNRG